MTTIALERSPTPILNERGRCAGVRVLLAEASRTLSPDAFVELAAGARYFLAQSPAPRTSVDGAAYPPLGDAALAYLRPIELLVTFGGTAGPLCADDRAELRAFLAALVFDIVDAARMRPRTPDAA